MANSMKKGGMGSVTLWQLSQEYARSADLIAGRVARLRQEEAETGDEAQRLVLRRRIMELRPLLRQCRQLQRLTERYYDRSYYRDEAYRI